MIDHHPVEIYKENLNNSNQRTFVIGDVHGNYDLLMTGLKENDITENDFLVFNGDLINKGSDTEKVLDFVLTRPNTLCLYGNHESVFLLLVDDIEKKQLYMDGMENCKMLQNYIDEMKAHWLKGKGFNYIKKYADLIKEKFYFAAEFDVNSEKIGVVHAAVPLADWNLLLDSPVEALWSFSYYNDEKEWHVKNIDKVIHGHVPVREVEHQANVIYIDTGSYYTKDKKLSFIRLV
tara:strand:+ start:27916 stop:28617 length:702 start_codon:yes stop_codon:yes gene_type:complete